MMIMFVIALVDIIVIRISIITILIIAQFPSYHYHHTCYSEKQIKF